MADKKNHYQSPPRPVQQELPPEPVKVRNLTDELLEAKRITREAFAKDVLK